MAICFCAGHDAVQKVTLIPRGQARGLTWFIPGEDPTLISKQQIFARIVGALGGRATEQVVFGDAEVTTGASSDLQQVLFPACSFRVDCSRLYLQFNYLDGFCDAFLSCAPALGPSLRSTLQYMFQRPLSSKHLYIAHTSS